MKYSMCADIMFVAPGEHGPLWPDANGLKAAMELAKENGLTAIEFFDFDGRDLDAVAAASKETGISLILTAEIWTQLQQPAKRQASTSWRSARKTENSGALPGRSKHSCRDSKTALSLQRSSV